MIDWRRAVVVSHRWLGTGGCLLFLAWFASGIVMMYARMPRLTPADRLAGLPPLDLADARVAPADAARRHGLAPERVRAAMLDARPAYRMLDGGRWVPVFADTGQRFQGFTPARALAEARRFAPARSETMRYDARMIEPDQWTLEERARLPMHRVAVGDAAGSVLYLSDADGEVVLRTSARGRRMAYAGAVVHWLYFTPLRSHGRLWARAVIALSGAGGVMCLLGLVWGVYVGIDAPYRGWMRWHHYAGLTFGAVSFTWVVSGMLSMDPMGWDAGSAPTRLEREAFAGGPLRLDGVGLDALRAALRAAGGAKEIEIAQFRGATRFVLDERRGPSIDAGALTAAAREALPDAAVVAADAIESYDAYYYDRTGALPLPAWRVRFADSAGTWLWIDPARGTIVRKADRLSRLNRWLYHGLHSLDFPWLYSRRPLWDAVVVLLSLGGMASAVTSIVPAFRRLRRPARHPYTWPVPGRKT